MADNETSNAGGEDTDQQITFSVKSSADAKYTITVPVTTTVAALKEKLAGADYANLSPERQRLIYSGRVLKDHDTIASCKIKEGNTVHLVRGAESNQRQNPANQGGTASIPGAGSVPTNIAAGTGAGNPLAQLTGARYAGFHGLPGADAFGADGGMGAPPNPDQMLRLLEDPNFAQQMNEAMNNPAVIDMLRNNPMIRNNPMARAAIENPDLRRMMMNPEMIRMQMTMQRAMGGGGAGAGGSFPMPGQVDTTPSRGESGTGVGENPSSTPNQPSTGTNPSALGSQPMANPFAALFPGMGGAAPAQTTDNNTAGNTTSPQANPFAGLFGGGGAAAGESGQQNPIAQMTQQLMQNPAAMQQMMQMMGGGGAGAGGGDAGAGGLGGFGGFNPWAAMGGAGFGGSEPTQPADDRPPEVRYESQLRQLNDMGFFEFERNVQALRRSGGSVQGAIEYLLSQ